MNETLLITWSVNFVLDQIFQLFGSVGFFSPKRIGIARKGPDEKLQTFSKYFHVSSIRINH